MRGPGKKTKKGRKGKTTAKGQKQNLNNLTRPEEPVLKKVRRMVQKKGCRGHSGRWDKEAPARKPDMGLGSWEKGAGL